MNAAAIPRRAHAASSSRLARGGRADEDEVDGRVVGEIVDRRDRRRCRGSCRPRGSSRRPRPRSPGSGCCAARRSRTSRGGSTRRRRRRRAGRTAPASAPCAAHQSAVRRSRPARRPRPVARRRRSAGSRRPTRRRARASASALSPRMRRRERVAVDRGLAAERSEQRLGLAARRSSRRRRSARAGTSRKLTSAIASARIPPKPIITQRPNCASVCRPAISSRAPRTIGATSRSTAPSSGVAARQQRVGGLAHRGLVAEVEPDEAALGLVRDRVAARASPPPGSRARSPRRPPRRRSRTLRSGSTGTPYSASRRFESGFGEVVDGEGSSARRR